MYKDYAPEALGESGLVRIVAPNPSPMTERGTNTYLIGTSDVVVIDPGPDLPTHLDAIEATIAGRPVIGVLVTHAHMDHAAAAHPLAQRIGAPVFAFIDGVEEDPVAGSIAAIGGGEGIDRSFAPDLGLAHGDDITGDGWTLTALHTPGHLSDHLSIHWAEANVTFTGDTVMGWASTMISPPEGNLGDFLASLDRLEAQGANRFYPGHGPVIDNPTDRCRALRSHRADRTREILAALPAAPTIPDLVAQIYADTPPALHGAAARNVLAHLLHLLAERRVHASPTPGANAFWERMDRA